MQPSDWIAFGALGLTALTVVVGVVQRHLDQRGQRTLAQFAVVYPEMFRVHRELYSRLSRLRDAFEVYADIQKGAGGLSERYPALDKAMDAFRRSLRQNDVILKDDVATELNRLWGEVKNGVYAYADSLTDRQPGDPPSARRKAVLDCIDRARQALRPYFRREYGLAD